VIGLNVDVLRLKTDSYWSPHTSFPVYTWAYDRMTFQIISQLQLYLAVTLKILHFFYLFPNYLFQ
jgi:hypothetical protein